MYNVLVVKINFEKIILYGELAEWKNNLVDCSLTGTLDGLWAKLAFDRSSEKVYLIWRVG